MRMMDIFSGLGSFSYAAQTVWGKDLEIVAFCEIDKFCRKILKKHWPKVEIINDIKNTEKFRKFKDIDLITAGCPCQAASVAGKQNGTSDERWLWPETIDIIGLVRPKYALLENVPGLFGLEEGLAFNGILSRLAEIGYDCWWEVIPACAVGAPHIRERIWIVAYRNNERQLQSEGLEQNERQRLSDNTCDAQCGGLQGQSRRRTRQEFENGHIQSEQNAADACQQRLSGNEQRKAPAKKAGTSRPVAERNWSENWYEVALRTCVRDVDDGVAGGLVRPKGWRVNALKALGNSIVPACAEVIMQAIKESEEL